MAALSSPKINAINYLKVNKEIIALVVISCITAFFFVFKGIFGGDSMHYLMGFQTVIEKGIVQIPQVFNGEMSLGYYLLLSFLEKIFGGFASLSSLMNNLNAIASVALQISLFLFFSSLYSDKKLSFFTCMAVLLSPSIWLLSHYGNPGLISLAFFINSLLIFDKIIRSEPSKKQSGFLWILFSILSTIAVVIRLDIVLAFGAFFGLLYFRRALSVSNVFKTSGSLLIVLFFLLAMRYFVLGYLINFSDSTLSYHIASRLEPEYIIRNIIKNCTEWVLSLNLLIAFLAVLGLFRFGFLSRFGVLLLSWIIPWSIFLVFRGMDTGRIIAPTIPIITLVAVAYVISVFRKRQVLVLISMLIISYAIAWVLYYPISKIYPFKKEIEGRVIASFPVGSLFADHYYRQKIISDTEQIAKLVTGKKDEDVMIIGGDGFMYYEYYLYQNRNVLSKTSIICNGAKMLKYSTTENEFYFLSLDNNWLTNAPIRKAVDCMKERHIRINIVPFWKENPTGEEELFLNEQAIQTLLDRETMVMKARRNMIYY